MKVELTLTFELPDGMITEDKVKDTLNWVLIRGAIAQRSRMATHYESQRDAKSLAKEMFWMDAIENATQEFKIS